MDGSRGGLLRWFHRSLGPINIVGKFDNIFGLIDTTYRYQEDKGLGLTTKFTRQSFLPFGISIGEHRGWQTLSSARSFCVAVGNQTAKISAPISRLGVIESLGIPPLAPTQTAPRTLRMSPECRTRPSFLTFVGSLDRRFHRGIMGLMQFFPSSP